MALTSLSTGFTTAVGTWRAGSTGVPGAGAGTGSGTGCAAGCLLLVELELGTGITGPGTSPRLGGLAGLGWQRGPPSSVFDESLLCPTPSPPVPALAGTQLSPHILDIKVVLSPIESGPTLQFTVNLPVVASNPRLEDASYCPLEVANGPHLRDEPHQNPQSGPQGRLSRCVSQPSQNFHLQCDNLCPPV